MATHDPLGIDYMCPFCVKPWKCNGPHIEPDDMPEFQIYIDNHWDEAIGKAVEAVYEDCHHTKYEGCQPCPHDVIAERVRKLETPELTALKAMAQEANWLGLYESTAGPPPATR